MPAAIATQLGNIGPGTIAAEVNVVRPGESCGAAEYGVALQIVYVQPVFRHAVDANRGHNTRYRER